MTHTYSTPGSYRARLTVTEIQGASGWKTITIQVGSNPNNIPGAPHSLNPTTVSRAELDLAWIDTANNESGFKIERRACSTCSNFSQIATAGADVKSYSNSGLKRNTTNRYRVLAYNVPGDSADSNLVSGKTLR